MASTRRRVEESNGVRLRTRKDPTLSEEDGLPGTKSDRKKRRRPPLPSSVVSIVLLFYSAIFMLQIYVDNYSLPTPLLLSDAARNPEEFIAERSMIRLKKLTALGPRVSASHANEVLAVKLLVDEASAIVAKAHKSKTIEIDVQRVSGSYSLTFLDGLTNFYRNVPNVVVRISSNPSWNHSLLVNCHFDSVVDSPGGSDDGASCANMLEMLEVLATSPNNLKHNVIFLFNGAEENLMHASHGFITQHRWAKEVRAFVNLEACGAGGREVLFQSGPNSPWIMQTYANTVPRPYASSMAQEIFESGIIPGDTDFRVFRDFGNVSGLDFAWSTNGYVYHTLFDNADQIPLGTLQRTGSNVLALIRGLANAPELEDPAKYRPGNLVYFDILGLVVIHWSETVANLLNLSALVLAIITVIVNRYTFQTKGARWSYYAELLKSAGVIVLGFVLMTSICFAIASYLAAAGLLMSWYGRPIWLLFLYVIPCITTVMAVKLIAVRWHSKFIQSKMVLVQLYYDAYLLFWAAALATAILFQIRSGCLAWLWTFSPTLATVFHRLLGYNQPEPSRGWFIIFLVGLFGPVLQYCSMQVGILSLFIPILGRAGATVNPDLIVGIYCSYTFVWLFSYSSPLIFFEKKPVRLLSVLAATSLISLFLLNTTSLGFPFSDNALAPRPERFLFVHTERVYYNYTRMETQRQGGYWIIDMDYTSPEHIKPYVPQTVFAQPVEDCEEHLYCGLPYLLPALSMVKKTHWIPGPPPTMGTPTELKMVGKEYFPGNRTMRLSFRATGPDHMGLILSPRENVTFVQWSINTNGPVPGPQWQGRPTYFVYYACAQDPEPWLFSIDLLPYYLKQPMVDIALTGHHLHGPFQKSKNFQRVLDQFPSWTAPTAWTSSYKSFVF